MFYRAIVGCQISAARVIALGVLFHALLSTLALSFYLYMCGFMSGCIPRQASMSVFDVDYGAVYRA